MAYDLFRERPGAAERILFTRSGRLRSARALLTAFGAPLFVVAMGYFALNIWVGLAAGAVAALLFGPLVADAWRRLWGFETLELYLELKKGFWVRRTPLSEAKRDFEFASVRAVVELTRGSAGRPTSRSVVLLRFKEGADLDLGEAPGDLAEVLAIRLSHLLSVPLQAEPAPDPHPFPKGGTDWSEYQR